MDFMKKKFVEAVFCFFLGFFAFAKGDSSLALQMFDAYEGGFYPGAVHYADEILKGGATSAYQGRAQVLKGECLFRLGMVEESLKTLSEGGKFAAENPALNGERCFWIGRGLLELEKNSAALSYLYKACEILKNAGLLENPVYAQAIFYSGKAFFKEGEYVQAVDCFEFVIQNGEKFSFGDFEEACVGLLESLCGSGQFKKCGEYFLQLEGQDAEFSPEAESRMVLARGQSLEGLGDYLSAYNCYVEVLTSGSGSLAAIAMQKAYLVSSAYSKQVQKNPGEVIEKAELLKKENPRLVSEFWIRLAIDAFNSKDYSRSLAYFKNAEENSSENLKQLALLYAAEIEFLTSDKGLNEAAASALKILDSGWERCGFEEGLFYYDYAMAAKARYYGFCGDWENSLKAALPQVNKTDNSGAKKPSVYWAALSNYSMEKYSEALELLNAFPLEDDDFLLLKAKTLAKTGNSSAADKIFYALEQNGSLSNDGRLDYARTLLNAGHLVSAVEQADKAWGGEADYMKALALFNRKNWAEAEKSFEKALSDKNLEKKYSELGEFYLGYSRYQLEKYGEALKNLETFLKSGDKNTLLFEAAVTAARCAVQIHQYETAEKKAKSAIGFSGTQEQKNQAVLLLAGIYSDSKKYSEAIEVLRPYAEVKNSFGFECRYLMAQFFVQNRDFELADKTYSLLAEEKNAGSLAEEACFRRGELLYVNQDYETAARLFEVYLKKYPAGKFRDASFYFEADSLYKTGRTEKASLYFAEIVDKPENSSYKYDSEKKLVEIYRNEKNYPEALKMAEKMLTDYGAQAEKDGIPALKAELVALNVGADEEILKKEREFEKAGGIKTKNGRKIGTELAEIYSKRTDMSGNAEKLASEIFEIQKTNEGESALAGKNALLLGEVFRFKNQNLESARMFLSAAEYCRKGGETLLAERSLYGAAEAFDAAGKKADAVSTAEALQSLYPESPYVTEIQRVLKNAE